MIRTRCILEEPFCPIIQEESIKEAHMEDAVHGKPGEKGDTGNGIEKVELNDDYTLSLYFTGGTVYTTPIPIRGKDGEPGKEGSGIVDTVWNPDGTITYSYGDGSTFTTPYLKGEPGDKGAAGESCAPYIGENGNWYDFDEESGEYVDTGVKAAGTKGSPGDKGDPGAGIVETQWNSDGTITYTYSDGSTFKTPYLKGEPGSPGSPGKPGKNGNGIKSTRWNADGTVTYTYDDGTTFTTGNLKGAPGDKGDTGEMSPEQIAQLNAATEKVATLDKKVDELELFKFPNANIVGEPLIENGNISRFSASDYLVFPFVVDVRNQPFIITMCFTTGSDVSAQQNILDSYFGMALAIQNGRGIMALSSNGTNWDIGLVTGVIPLEPNKTYYARISWDGAAYRTALSADGVTFVDDMYAGTTAGLYPTTMYIGASPNIFGAGSSHPFGGTVNMNKCHLSVAGLEVWQGMDDAGLSTRADLSLSNLDAEGEKRFTERYTKQEADNKFALKTELPTVPTNVSEFVNDAGYLTEHQSLAGYATEKFVSDEFARQLALLDGNGVAY